MGGACIRRPGSGDGSRVWFTLAEAYKEPGNTTKVEELTEERSQLEQSTLCALIGCKLNSLHSCFQLETPDNLL